MISFKNRAPIRCHDTRDSERPGWGRLNLRIPPELWAKVQAIRPGHRGKMTLGLLAEAMGVKLVVRKAGRPCSR